LGFVVLERIVRTMAEEARNAGVLIVCGDTKVVERGMGSGLFINTSGVGAVTGKEELSPVRIRPGDKVLINGPVADHGIAVLAARRDISLETPVTSDCAALNTLTRSLREAAPNTRCMRDPTRGGIASVLNEWIEGRPYGIELREDALPLRDATRAVCELLGFDPLTVANEGKVIVVTPPDEADAALSAMRAHPRGRESRVIGTVTADRPGKVVLHTTIGTARIVPMPSGELLPRIC
jgi:hydrogenase expression/formation protein HypE